MNRAAPGLLFFLLAAAPLAAQENTAVASDDPLLVQRRLAMVLRQSTKHYDAGEYQAALDRLGALQGSLAQDLSVLNLRGAILTKTGDYAQARRLFEAVLAADPEYFPAAYNLGEVEFVQGDYAAALRTFQQIRRRDPRNELVRFKIMVCHLLLGEQAEAERLAAGFIPAGSTPAWYYAQAMLARRAGDAARAARHLAVARSIYGDESCRLFDESVSTVNF
jgi:tetratricopeptide (TPR) repeat protein